MAVRGPNWVREYIGIPYVNRGYSHAGCFCWGLVVLVQQEQFHRRLLRHDEFSYEGLRDAEKAGKTLIHYLPTVSREWYNINLDDVDLGDVLILNLMGHPIHIACAVSDTHMLHQLEGCDSVCEEIRTPLWERRIHSVWRHYSAGI